MLKARIPILLLILSFMPVACGYHFAPSGEHIDKSIQTVFVDIFTNRTSDANIENYMRNAFIDEFRRGVRFRLAEDKNNADAILTGRINRIDTSHLSYTSIDIAKEDRLTLTMEVIFKEAGGSIIWSNNTLSEKEVFTVDSNSPNTTSTNRREALRELSATIAEKTYRNILSGF